jgi:hypothetical protein
MAQEQFVRIVLRDIGVLIKKFIIVNGRDLRMVRYATEQRV